MKKILSILMIMCAFSAVTFAGNSNYKLNSGEVNNMFNNATEVSIESMVNQNMASNAIHKFNLSSDDVQTTILVAIIVDAFVGGLGIHRYVLGTKSSMWALYTFTCGGIFGLVPFVDFWVLIIDGLVNENAGKYLDNEEFMMWL